MNIVCLQGIHGGVGVTTLTASLGAALHRQGKRVLLVELGPDHLLGIHANLAVDDHDGWAVREAAGDDWQAGAYALDQGLYLLPHGYGVPSPRSTVAQWRYRLETLSSQFDWVVIDVPMAFSTAWTDLATAGMGMRVGVVDPACHTRLMRHPGDRRRLLVNRYDPSSALQRDILQLWQLSTEQLSLVPVTVHEDASVPEALAQKLTVGRHAADSLAAANIDSLAVWLTIQAARTVAHA